MLPGSLRVRQLAEQYSTLGPCDSPGSIAQLGYRNFLREPLRTYARDEAQRYAGLSIKDNIERIGGALTARVLAITRDTPFEVRSAIVGNIQYPAQIVDAVSQKLAATQEPERKNT